MLAIVLLFSSIALVSANDSSMDISLPVGASVDIDPINFHIDFPPMKNLSEQARKEFVNILFNQTLTIAQLEAEVKAWAAKNGVVDAVNQEIAKEEQRTKDRRVNVTRALAELPAAITKLNALEDNKSLTVNQIYEQSEALFQSLKTPYLRRLLETVSFPDYVEGEEPSFSIGIANKRRR